MLYAGGDAGAPSAHIIGVLRGRCFSPAGTPALPVCTLLALCAADAFRRRGRRRSQCAHYWLYARPMLFAGGDAGAPSAGAPSAHIISVMRGRCFSPAGTPALPVPALPVRILLALCASDAFRRQGRRRSQCRRSQCADYWRYARPLLFAGRDAGAPSAGAPSPHSHYWRQDIACFLDERLAGVFLMKPFICI